MFESLSGRLGDVFEKLRRRGALSATEVETAMRDIRVALLEADVALPVVRGFIERVTEQAAGQDVLRSVTPGQMVVKIVHDELVAMLGDEATGIDQLIIMMQTETIPHEKVMKSIDLFGRYVIPEFNKS